MREYGTVKTAPQFEECYDLRGKNARSRYNKRVKIWNKTGGYCSYCGRELIFNGINAFHSDHVLPKIQGGSNAIENLVPSCEHCNKSKGGRTPKQWLEAT